MVYIYDGTYEGLLSCIFVIFRDQITPVAINPGDSYQPSLLDEVTRVTTNNERATRVIRGIHLRADSQAVLLIYKIFLSELPQSEMLVYQVIRAIIHKGDASILENFANPFILRAMQIEKMIHREVHRMHAFVRFQKSYEGLFYAAIDPDFNVLPLIGDHFERRYADQPWLIFDTKRHYGLYYDCRKTDFVDLENPVFSIDRVSLHEEQIQDEKEKEYQSLWKNYFHAVNIRERNNKKLHLRHMPRRYWKYLIEKN
jgi:probable DNA metabolism protein